MAVSKIQHKKDRSEWVKRGTIKISIWSSLKTTQRLIEIQLAFDEQLRRLKVKVKGSQKAHFTIEPVKKKVEQPALNVGYWMIDLNLP